MYNELLKNVDPENPHYKVYQVFCLSRQKILFRALCEGFAVGTPEFT